MKRGTASLLALVAFALIPARLLADATYSDGTFNNADWTATAILNTGSPAYSFTDSQQTSGGNPGDFREVVHTLSGSAGSLIVAHMNTGDIYNPAANGPISTIDFSYDLIQFNPPANQAVAYDLLLFQNGSYYSSSGDLIFTNSWTPFSHVGLTASDFVLAVPGAIGPAHPDFSATGSLIDFGYLSGNSNTGAGSDVRDSGIDNWSVTLHSPVPEPVSLLLLGTGSLGLLFSRRSCKK